MNPETTFRLALALGILGFGVAIFFISNRVLLTRARGNISKTFFADKKPVLLYFTTPACAPCKTIQRPAIHHLAEILGERIQIVEIDAANNPEIASSWGVMSVPTTFIIDAQGQPRHVNHGIASAEKLRRQLNDYL